MIGKSEETWKYAFIAVVAVNALLLVAFIYWYARRKILENLGIHSAYSDPLIPDFDSINSCARSDNDGFDIDSNPSVNSLFSPPIRHNLSIQDLRALRPAADIRETDQYIADGRLSRDRQASDYP
mmetsp:Transcript_380/g.450  ORF Transcript_380/g.450 Transcript_380/m.450 type:complete len:125 (-) Transcript_380:138-512(-)